MALTGQLAATRQALLQRGTACAARRVPACMVGAELWVEAGRPRTEPVHDRLGWYSPRAPLYVLPGALRVIVDVNGEVCWPAYRVVDRTDVELCPQFVRARFGRATLYLCAADGTVIWQWPQRAAPLPLPVQAQWRMFVTSALVDCATPGR